MHCADRGGLSSYQLGVARQLSHPGREGRKLSNLAGTGRGGSLSRSMLIAGDALPDRLSSFSASSRTVPLVDGPASALEVEAGVD